MIGVSLPAAGPVSPRPVAAAPAAVVATGSAPDFAGLLRSGAETGSTASTAAPVSADSPAAETSVPAWSGLPAEAEARASSPPVRASLPPTVATALPAWSELPIDGASGADLGRAAPAPAVVASEHERPAADATEPAAPVIVPALMPLPTPLALPPVCDRLPDWPPTAAAPESLAESCLAAPGASLPAVESAASIPTDAPVELAASPPPMAATPAPTPAPPALPPAEAMTGASPPVLDLQAPDWPERLGERIRWSLEGGVQEARIQLAPEGLGSLDLDVRIEGGEVHLRIGASHAPTRELLGEALPRLRELLGDSGLSLGQTDVYSQQERATPSRPLLASGRNAAAAEAEPAPVPRIRTAHGLIDHYA